MQNECCQFEYSFNHNVNIFVYVVVGGSGSASLADGTSAAQVDQVYDGFFQHLLLFECVSKCVSKHSRIAYGIVLLTSNFIGFQADVMA